MASINITERQAELLKAVIEVMKADIDFAKVAELANFNSTKYARDAWRELRNKLVGQTAKASADNNGDAEGTNGEAGTPNGKPKKKATPRKRKSDGDDAESPTKKKATPRKSKSATPAKAEEDEDVTVKDEPNEAGEAMDALN